MNVSVSALESVSSNFSEFGLHYIQKTIAFIIPEGHPIVKDWFLMKWWQVMIVSLSYPFFMGNLRVYRFESHPKPITAFSTVGLLFTAFSVIVYIFILYEIIMYFGYQRFFVCHTVEESEQGVRIASVLWYFHIARLFSDLVNTVQSALTKPVMDLKSEQSINEIRFTLTHFVVWWMILLYHPGGEVLYPVATVCMFYLGTIACAFSQGKFINLKMGLWVLLVVSNFGRLLINVYNGCTFPSAVLTVSPPYDINSNVHLIIYYFLSWIPAGSIFHYMMYWQGREGSWWILLFFLLCAHWPSGTREKGHEKSKNGLTTSVANGAFASFRNPLRSASKASKKEKAREKKRERIVNTITKINSTLNSSNNANNANNSFADHSSSSANNNNNNNNNNNGTLDGDVSVAKQPLVPTLLYRKCGYSNCDTYETKPKAFKVCERCRVPYCSKECQVTDWEVGGHKSYCKMFIKVPKNTFE